MERLSLDQIEQELERRRIEAAALNLLPEQIRASVSRRRKLAEYFESETAPPICPWAPLPRPTPGIDWTSEASVIAAAAPFRKGARTLAQAAEMARCAADPQYWFDNWVWTFDPRLAKHGRNPWLPFDFFQKQRDMLTWLEARIEHEEFGLCEKSRDTGFSWVVGGLCIHKWLFILGWKTTIISYLEDKVDSIGDPDSFFEKMRMLLYRLPAWMQPVGFSKAANDNFMRLVNPENDNVITGAVGSNAGRAGRSSWVIVDEAAYLDKAERVEGAIAGNTEIQIWGSTANTMGSLFAKKRFNGDLEQRQLFRIHYTDDPRKTPEWAAKKKKSLSATPWVWYAEYEIDYSASVEGIAIPAVWVNAAVRLRSLLKEIPDFSRFDRIGALDVGAGKNHSVYIERTGPMPTMPEAWNDPDTINTANRAIDRAKASGAKVLKYDSVGVGRSVTDTMARQDLGDIKVVPINTGLPPTEAIWPDKLKSSDKFANLKAEAWWIVREGIRRSFELVNFIEGRKDEEGHNHPLEDVIFVPNDTQLILELSLLKWFKTEKGKIIMETKIQLASRGVKSPDRADAFIILWAPEPTFAEEGFFNMIQAHLARLKAQQQER